MPPCCAARSNALPSLHLLSLNESTGVKVKDVRSGDAHPDPRVRAIAVKWDHHEMQCGVCLGMLDEDALTNEGEEKALEIEVLVENPLCEHVFHRLCIEKLVRGGALTCPLCKAPIKQSVINDVAPGYGFVELDGPDEQRDLRGYDDFYGEENNQIMLNQNVDPADDVDDLVEGDMSKRLNRLIDMVSDLSDLSELGTERPPVLMRGLDAVAALLETSSIGDHEGVMEERQLWHHAYALRASYIIVNKWPQRTRDRMFDWFKLFDNAMLFLRMDRIELRRVLIHVTKISTPRGRMHTYKMAEKKASDLPGLDRAIDMVEKHKNLSAMNSKTILSDEQVKAFEYYTSEARDFSQWSPIVNELYAEMEQDNIEKMLQRFKTFLPDVEDEARDFIKQSVEEVAYELARILPSALPVLRAEGFSR